ncbi:MAG: GIY-YIG nuclease family protein [Thaumarchaeota archaeon]|nr:GIY-YIG nuclease family protein [Nitrososphaerota archaeon]
MKGVYVLLLECKRNFETNVGSLGKILFLRGNYAYVGSALNSLERRVERHGSRFKSFHWHVDHLTLSKHVSLRFAIYAETDFNHECAIGQHISKVVHASAIPRFGSSDCKQHCRSHLFLLHTSMVPAVRMVTKAFQDLNLELITHKK